jgi:hypothetical protein
MKKKKKHILLLILISIFCSCNGNLEDNKMKNLSKSTLKEKNIVDFDTNNFKRQIKPKNSLYAIYLYPDSSNRNKLLELNGEDIYESILDDNMEQNHEILIYLESKEINVHIHDEEFVVLEYGKTLKRNHLKNPYFSLILVNKSKNKFYELNNDNYKKITNEELK